ncbi:MAG: DUF2244 domain-containing protein [Alphaproteobacteria bacterium]
MLFDAVLTPSRSLPPLAARHILVAFFLLSCGVGLAFLVNGWWPIAGYFGLDALLLWWAFRASYRSGRLVERLHLTARALTVARVHPNGNAVEWTFQPTWLRVEMDDPPQHQSQLTLRSHGRAITVGRFLTPDERLEVARALRAALVDARRPALA